MYLDLGSRPDTRNFIWGNICLLKRRGRRRRRYRIEYNSLSRCHMAEWTTRKCNNTTNNNNTQIKRHRHEPCKFSLSLSHPIVPSFHPTGEEKRRGRGTLMTTTKLIPPTPSQRCTVLCSHNAHRHKKSRKSFVTGQQRGSTAVDGRRRRRRRRRHPYVKHLLCLFFCQTRYSLSLMSHVSLFLLSVNALAKPVNHFVVLFFFLSIWENCRCWWRHTPSDASSSSSFRLCLCVAALVWLHAVYNIVCVCVCVGQKPTCIFRWLVLCMRPSSHHRHGTHGAYSKIEEREREKVVVVVGAAHYGSLGMRKYLASKRVGMACLLLLISWLSKTQKINMKNRI